MVALFGPLVPAAYDLGKVIVTYIIHFYTNSLKNSLHFAGQCSVITTGSMNYTFPIKFPPFHITIIFIIALLSLAGWHFEIGALKHPIEGGVAMNPLTAVGFMVAGGCLLLLYYSKGKRYLLTYARLLAFVIIIIGSIRIFSVATGFNFRIDTLMYAQQIKNDIINGMPNSMAPNTAFNFLLMGVGVFHDDV